VQPGLSRVWLETGFEPIGDLTQWLVDSQTLIVVLCTAPFAALAWRRRMDPPEAATLLWLAFYVFASAFAFQYAVWGLPFALMAGWVRGVALLQAALLVPTLLIYSKPFDSGSEYVYVPLMIGIWLALIAVLARLALSAAQAARPRIGA
jgi:hypothetical protein